MIRRRGFIQGSHDHGSVQQWIVGNRAESVTCCYQWQTSLVMNPIVCFCHPVAARTLMYCIVNTNEGHTRRVNLQKQAMPRIYEPLPLILSRNTGRFALNSWTPRGLPSRCSSQLHTPQAMQAVSVKTVADLASYRPPAFEKWSISYPQRQNATSCSSAPG